MTRSQPRHYPVVIYLPRNGGRLSWQGWQGDLHGESNPGRSHGSTTVYPRLSNISFESESVNTCGKNKFETIFFQNFSRIFKSVSMTGFKTSHTAFTCSKKSSMLQLFQRVIRNWCKIDTNRGSITNWGKIITNRDSFNCFKSGQQLLQIGSVLVITNRSKIITNRGRYYKLWQLLQIGAEQRLPRNQTEVQRFVELH